MNPQSPSILLAGTGVASQRAADIYYSSFRLACRSDVMCLPGRGLPPLEETWPIIERELLARLKNLGVRAQLIGHSQGGHPAVRFGQKYPELVHTVKTLDSPHGGLDETVHTVDRWARKVLPESMHSKLDMIHELGEDGAQWFMRRHFPGLHSLAFDGPAVQELRVLVEESWSPDVTLVQIVGGNEKIVLPRRSALALNPPVATTSKKYYFDRPWRKPHNLPQDVRFVPSLFSGHLLEVFDPQVIGLAAHYSREKPVSGRALADAS